MAIVMLHDIAIPRVLNASTLNIHLSLSLQSSLQMGLVVIDKKGGRDGDEKQETKFYILSLSSQTSIRFSCE